MNVIDLTSGDFVPLLPALILAVGACVLLLTEVFLQVASRRSYQSVMAVVAALLAGTVALNNAFLPAREVFGGFGVLDPFSSFMTAMVCLGLLLAALTAAGFLQRRNAERGEFYALMLFAAAGMSLLASSNELITVFVSIEVMSIATYALASYLRRGPRPSEAGFKYFILGAFSTALLLYGTSLLYGVTGTTRLGLLAGPLAIALRGHSLLAMCGVLLVGAGFAFKIAAVPFHMWTPDVYEGAPTPVTALMSVGVKAAAFASLVRVFLVIGKAMDPQVTVLMFAVLAFLTMVLGNLLALPQRNVKRMLAYSSIAHAGYVLVGVTALFVRPGPAGSNLFGATPLMASTGALATQQTDAIRGILFYLLGYTVTAVGAFGTLSALEHRDEEDRGTAWDLDRFSGLAQRRPGWAFAMAVFMLSLGGIPPTVGFMGKLLIFRSAVDAGLIGLTIAGVLSSAAGVYYYLRVVVYMFMRPAPEGAAVLERHWTTEVALVASTLAVVGLGVLPGTVSNWFSHLGMIWGL